jgi:hypothetical protein
VLHANDVHHVIVPDLILRAPFAFKLQIEASGKTLGVENLTGVKLALIPASSETQSAESFADVILRSLKQRHSDLQTIGEAQAASGEGWSGQARMFRVGFDTKQHKRLVLTTLMLVDTHRYFALLLEVPEALFAERLMFFRRFTEQRLRYVAVSDAVATAPATEPATELGIEGLSLVAMDAPEVCEPMPAINLTAPSEHSALRPNLSAAPQRGRINVNVSGIASPLNASPEPIEAQLQSERLREAALGQRTLNISIALNFVLSALARNSEIHWALILAMASALLFYALSGVLRFGSAFGYGKTAKLALMLLSSVPLVSLLLWLVLSVSTTRKLREAGFEVGLLGARL